MRQKLNELIAAGADIEFSYNGVMDTILPWTDNGIVIGIQGTDDGSAFTDTDALFDGYMVDGVPLGSVVDEISIDFTS